jgi:hypothetical protein
MQLHFNIDMRKPGVSNVALFLGALSLIREGLDFAINGGADRFTFDPNEQIYHIHILNPQSHLDRIVEPNARFLSDLGRSVLESGQWYALAKPGTPFLYDLLKRIPPDRDIRLSTLKTGSLDGVIDDLIDAIGSWFHRILSSSTKFIYGENNEEIKSILNEVARTSTQSRETKNAGIGLVIIGAEVLATSYKIGEVSQIHVQRNY